MRFSYTLHGVMSDGDQRRMLHSIPYLAKMRIFTVKDELFSMGDSLPVMHTHLTL